jgi:hypothetical protein
MQMAAQIEQLQASVGSSVPSDNQACVESLLAINAGVK